MDTSTFKGSRPALEALFLRRQSVRAYRDQPVEKEKLLALAEAVRLAPSASNGQPWKLIFVTEPELKAQVAAATFSKLIAFNAFVPQAPVLAVLTIEKTRVITQIGGRMKKREFPLIDIGIAAEHFCLEAAALGLGTCMLGWFDEPTIQKLLHIPAAIRIGLVIPVGYAPENYPQRKKKRKNLEEILTFNSY